MSDFIVREARAEDAEGIIAHIKRVADEPNNGIAMSSADEFKMTLEEETELIKKAAESDNMLMVVAEADGEIIALANCFGGDRGYQWTLSLGITVRREWRGRGVGRAVMQYMIDWCRANSSVHRLELWVFPDNPVAIHLYEKLGFEHEGNRRASYLKDGDHKDLLLMGMLFER
jgi:RimJ/RimL family protein N-acetyltransferase